MLAADEFQFLEGDARRVGVATIPEVRREFVETGDGDISLLRFGAAPPKFSFLHGAGLNAHTFDPTILRLESPSLTFDLPGHGRSAWRTDARYQPEALSAAVAQALRSTSDDPQILVGHSLGGLTSLAVAAEHPQLIRHLVIVDITPGISLGDGGDTIREFISGQKTFESVDEIVDRAIAFEIGHDREALRRGITLNTRMRPDGTLEWTHHLAHMTGELLSPNYAALWDAVNRIQDAGIPMTLIRGSQGMVQDVLLAEWAERASSAPVITIEAGHNIQEHNPVALADALSALAES